jgi:mRNA interferase RelE/StbE
MTYSVIWLPEAMTAYRVLRTADPDGAKRVAKAIAALAVDSHPAESNALGGTSYGLTDIACSMRSLRT